MVNFGDYLESMVQLKPEWRNAYINYALLNELLSQIKKSVRCESVVSLQPNAEASPSETEQQLIDDSIVHEDDDAAFAVERSKSVHATQDSLVNCVDERSALLRSVPVASSVQSPTSFAAIGTPPLSPEYGHRVFGHSYRHKLLETAVRPPSVESAERSASVPTEPITPPLPPAAAAAAPSEEERTLEKSAVELPFPTRVPVPSPANSMQLIPCISNEGMSAAKAFEDLLFTEVSKALAFAEKSYDAFADFVSENRANWKKDRNARTKDSLRYVNREVGHLIQFIDTNQLAIKTAIKKYMRSHPFFVRPNLQESTLLPPFERVSDRASQLQGVTAAVWAELFMGGDINAARARIASASASATQSFRAGFFFALILGCGLYWLHVKFELQPSTGVMDKSAWMFPISRLFLTLLFALICWSWVLFVCERGRINYLYVFEFSQTASTTWMQCLEYALFMFFLCALCSVLYVRSSLSETRLSACYSTAAGFPYLTPYCMPAFLLTWLLTIIFPVRHVFKKTRSAFGRVFLQCMKLPFGDVRFVEFIVADWGTSMVFPCYDLLYTICFYTAEAHNAFTNTESGTCLAVQQKYGNLVAMIPYYWRACQTYKMYLKTGAKIHLVNHAKYQTFIVYFLVSFAHSMSPAPWLNGVVWFWHFAAQIYAWTWDILMDWGFIRGRDRQLMFKSYKPYIVAGIADFVLRMYFVFCTLYIQPVIGQNYMYLIQGMAEVFRRSMWSIFRIENENVNNLENYRKIDFVPHVAPRDEFVG